MDSLINPLTFAVISLIISDEEEKNKLIPMDVKNLVEHLDLGCLSHVDIECDKLRAIETPQIKTEKSNSSQQTR